MFAIELGIIQRLVKQWVYHLVVKLFLS